MNPERFLSILSATVVMIGLLSHIQVIAASSFDADAFSSQFPNVDKMTRQEIADLRRSFAQKTIKELKEQKEATGEIDPGLFVMDIKADADPAQKTSEKIDEDEGPSTAADINGEEELMSLCQNAEDMDWEEVIDVDEENADQNPPADNVHKGDKQIDSKQSSDTMDTSGKSMEPTQVKSSTSDTSTNQAEQFVRKESTSYDGNQDDKTQTQKKSSARDKTQTPKKSNAPDNNPKDEAISKHTLPQKPNENKESETKSPTTDNNKDVDQDSSSMGNNDREQTLQKSSSGVVNDEDKKQADKKTANVRIPSPASDGADKGPTRHESTPESTASNAIADRNRKKNTVADKTDKESKKKKSTDERTKVDPGKPSKVEL